MTICAGEATTNRRGRSPRSERGAPLPKARATRKIDLAKPQQADCHLFGARVNRTSGQDSRKTSMESRARHILATKKISEVGSSMGKKDEILGRFFGAWHFALLDTRTGQVGFMWINQGTGYARSQAA